MEISRAPVDRFCSEASNVELFACRFRFRRREVLENSVARERAVYGLAKWTKFLEKCLLVRYISIFLALPGAHAPGRVHSPPKAGFILFPFLKIVIVFETEKQILLLDYFRRFCRFTRSCWVRLSVFFLLRASFRIRLQFCWRKFFWTKIILVWVWLGWWRQRFLEEKSHMSMSEWKQAQIEYVKLSLASRCSLLLV